MLVCRSCGSSKVRTGYQPPPLLLRLLFVRTMLCDSCNRQFYAFRLRPPVSHREKHRSRRRSNAFAPVSAAVDLSRLNQVLPESILSVENGRVTAPGIATVIEGSDRVEARSRAGGDKQAGHYFEDGSGESEGVQLKQSSRPRCPRCQSIHTRRRHRNPVERVLLLLSENRAYICEGCGKNFYARKPSRVATV